MKTELLTRFLGYTKIHTTSDENSTTNPSTKQQLDLSRALEAKCLMIGLTDVSLDSNGYLMATLPANTVPPILCSHLTLNKLLFMTKPRP